MSCCSRLLVDHAYIGRKFEVHEQEGSHEWLDDGDVCCGSPAGSKHQRCYCGAGRWTSLARTAEQIAEGAVSAAKIARWHADEADRIMFRAKLEVERSRLR